MKSTDKNQLFFPYTNDKQSEKEIIETIIFTKWIKRIKYLGILLTKKVKLHTENYKILLKEIKEHTKEETHVFMYCEIC